MKKLVKSNILLNITVVLILLTSLTLFWEKLLNEKQSTTQVPLQINNVFIENMSHTVGTKQPLFSHNLSSFFAENLREIPDETFLDNFSSFFKMNKDIVNPFWPPFSSFTADGLCRHSDDRKPFLLVAVPSVVSHTEQRKAIRETWASVAYGKRWPRQVNPLPSVRVVFVFGNSQTPAEDSTLRAESADYGDVVQAEFEDSYGNLSLKTLTILRWMTTFCPTATHLVKVDEDTFLNVPLLLQLLATLRSRISRYVVGFIYTSRPSRVHRDGKWALIPHLYPPKFYPYYTVGHSYVISGDCVRELALAFRHFRLITVEDALFTGILSKSLNISRINCRLFASRHRERKKCNLIRVSYVSETLCDVGRLRLVWRCLEIGDCPDSGLPDEQHTDLVSVWKPRGRRWQW